MPVTATPNPSNIRPLPPREELVKRFVLKDGTLLYTDDPIHNTARRGKIAGTMKGTPKHGRIVHVMEHKKPVPFRVPRIAYYLLTGEDHTVVLVDPDDPDNLHLSKLRPNGVTPKPYVRIDPYETLHSLYRPLPDVA